MRSLVPKLLGASLVLLVALVCVPGALAAPAVTGQFELKTELNDNNKIVAGPDGNMWFTEPGKKIGKISPAGIVQEFELKGIENTIGIAVGPEKRIWVVATNKATSFLPSDPVGTEEDFASALINGEPNIVLGPEGKFWVASGNKVAKFSPDNFNGTIVEVPLTGELSPKDIDVAGSLIAISDNFNTPVTEKGRIVTFSSAGVQHDLEIPGSSQGLAGAPSGQIAFSAAGANPEQAGLVSPSSPASAFELVGDPFGVALGADGAFWIVDFNFGGLTRLTTTGQTSFLGGLPAFTARQVAPGPNQTLWLTLVKKEGVLETSAIARVSGVELPVTSTTNPPPTNPPPPPPVPQTNLGKGLKKKYKVTAGKATIKATFSSTVAGSSFQCRVQKMPTPTGKKKKKPKGTFTACSSPKVLHLAPGKYRFAVRAVVGGVTDSTPAERGFKVIRVHRHR
jgi:virginiamycin B lyase